MGNSGIPCKLYVFDRSKNMGSEFKTDNGNLRKNLKYIFQRKDIYLSTNIFILNLFLIINYYFNIKLFGTLTLHVLA